MKITEAAAKIRDGDFPCGLNVCRGPRFLHRQGSWVSFIGGYPTVTRLGSPLARQTSFLICLQCEYAHLSRLGFRIRQIPDPNSMLL